jgi:RND family efflux transporter MFP subunit
MKAAIPLFVLCAAAATLAGCKEKEVAAPPVRPVLFVVAEPENGRTLGFAGTVEPQYKVGFGFRVLGRIVARDVNVGDTVKRDQQLAAIDSVALELAVRTAQADVANAQARLVNAAGVLGRQQILLQQNTATQAEFDSAQQAQQTAAAMVSQAQANLAKAQEQLGYSKLLTDFDGIVTSVDAEVGEVVSPGQAVITVARPDIREAVVDVPEEIANTLVPGAEFKVALVVDPAIVADGKVREVAPQADAATRTRRVKITLQQPPINFRLGTTIIARLTRSTNPTLHLPISALLERDGKTMVWTVDTASKTVNLRDIKVAARNDQDFQVADGLPAGTRVVVAGIHSLKPGQAVKIAQEANQ